MTGRPPADAARALEKLQVKIGGMACSFCAETSKKDLGRTGGVAEAHVEPRPPSAMRG